jgi:hypothetical protein
METPEQEELIVYGGAVSRSRPPRRQHRIGHCINPWTRKRLSGADIQGKLPKQGDQSDLGNGSSDVASNAG